MPRMTDDFHILRHRERQERAQAAAADDRSARFAHLEMARLYGERIAACDGPRRALC